MLSITLIAGATAPTYAQSTLVVFDDMEHGDPFNNGWFAFGGSVGGGGIGPNSDDLPPENGGAYSMETGWGSGGTPGYFGGFGRTFLSDLSGMSHFNFWINPDVDQDYTLEINLQEDDNGNDAIDPADDDEFQYNCVVSPAGPCAVSGNGWQLVSIPLADFFDDNSYLTGGNGVLDPVPVTGGGNGQLVNVVIAVISNSGADVNFRTDYWVFSDGPLVYTPSLIIDDFEDGLPVGTDGDGVAIGFYTFQGANSSIAISTTATPPDPVPTVSEPNSVLQVDVDSTAYAGLIHGFENDAVDTWVPQNWMTYEGISFWLYGNNSGTALFVDLLENRNPDSTTDDAERWTVTFTDDFYGWQLFKFPFTDFIRKEVGNGAPNDGLTLTEVHGWAFGTLDTGGPRVYYIDNVTLYGVGEVPSLAVSFALNKNNIDEGTTGDITVKLNRPITEDDPAQVSVDYATESAASIAIAGREYTPVSGTLTFVNGGPSEQTFSIETFDDSKYEGDERIVLRLSNPVDIELGGSAQASAFIVDNDEYDRNLLDDFERGAYLWNTIDGRGKNIRDGDIPRSKVTEQSLPAKMEASSPEVSQQHRHHSQLPHHPTGDLALFTPEIHISDALARPGQDEFEHILEVSTPVLVDIVVGGSLCHRGNGVIPVAILTTDDFDATTVDHTSVRFGDAAETHSKGKSGDVTRHEKDFDLDGDIDLVFHFRAKETGYTCESTNLTLTGQTSDGQFIVSNGKAVSFIHDFALGQDWTRGEAVSFWYYGTNSGDPIAMVLKENRAADPGPTGWKLVWSDEFNDPAGTPPNPANWSYEIGDVTPDGKNGWGNNELQYYTNEPANAATDGNGNLALTLQESDGSLNCYYGPCEYTSARLISWHKAEFAYGRIESRLKVPQGTGIWPAFWSLGTDIDRNPWPGAGEIDFMEFVGRLPNEIFGTIHGPGYAGGASFGGVYNFGGPVYDDYHTFAVEWEPNLIRWYVDGILYHQAAPSDVAPNEWVFNDPIFLLLNVAVGGNFGGEVGDDLVPPQSMLVDYVRVYQGPDTAERWEATFTDNFSGWQQVVIPFDTLTRSAHQPPGAPDDGLTLDEVWGYGFKLPEGGISSGTMLFDQGRLVPIPPPTALTVTNLNDSGPGSLRQALEEIAIGGTISFDPGLSGGTITLSSGPLVPANTVTIDASAVPAITLNGGGTDRLLIVDPSVNVTVKGLTFTNGYGWQLAGGILNDGSLTLDHVIVTGNTMATDAGDYWQGGGGIYNGEGSTLNLIDSAVVDNNAGWSGGGVYSFFNTATTIERSTISGNISNDVGGGIRLLGNAEIINSTISGNEATGWYGGAMFITDGVANVTNSTVADNVSPTGAPADVFVGTFTDASATLTLNNSIISSAQDNCFYAPWGAGVVTLTADHNNVFTDATCFAGASDQVVADAGLSSLVDNGGPTQTHALLAGSPAIDAADVAVCPATDQRGVARPQGAACDVGAFELE